MDSSPGSMVAVWVVRIPILLHSLLGCSLLGRHWTDNVSQLFLRISVVKVVYFRFMGFIEVKYFSQLMFEYLLWPDKECPDREREAVCQQCGGPWWRRERWGGPPPPRWWHPARSTTRRRPRTRVLTNTGSRWRNWTTYWEQQNGIIFKFLLTPNWKWPQKSPKKGEILLKWCQF